MRNNILTLLVGFVVMLGSVMLFKLGLDKMTDAGAATQQAYAKLEVDLNRRAILYRVQAGDTLWGLSERFYGAGRRWVEIAQANNLNADSGLSAGTIIRIPLASHDEGSPELMADAIEPEMLPEPPPPSRFSIDDGVISLTLAQLDFERFATGALCVARAGENQRVRIGIYDAAGSGEGAPIATYEAPPDNQLREMWAEDTNGDRSQEIFTIWHTPTDSLTTRILKWQDGALTVIRETPDDPLAMHRIRAREMR
jgi:hypothetical protein